MVSAGVETSPSTMLPIPEIRNWSGTEIPRESDAHSSGIAVRSEAHTSALEPSVATVSITAATSDGVGSAVMWCSTGSKPSAWAASVTHPVRRARTRR